jgi:hypothetical protein
MVKKRPKSTLKLIKIWLPNLIKILISYCRQKIGLAVKRQKSQRAKNHYFGIFGQENLIFQKIIGFVSYKARSRSKKKLEKTF